jgi:hypothetical protein
MLAAFGEIDYKCEDEKAAQQKNRKHGAEYGEEFVQKANRTQHDVRSVARLRRGGAWGIPMRAVQPRAKRRRLHSSAPSGDYFGCFDPDAHSS